MFSPSDMQRALACSTNIDIDLDDSDMINIAVEGCCHGELDIIYDTISALERKSGKKVHLLLICGDFQSLRSTDDFGSLNVPNKYKKLNSFTSYFNGTKSAPMPTIFIGGNHESSNVLQSLYYGGYVAKNIYFMGFAGVVNFAGIRIAGCSGIYNDRHYKCGHFERFPYTEETVRSIYHVRELEVYRLAHLNKEGAAFLPYAYIGSGSSSSVDIFLSHDWPAPIWSYGNVAQLLRHKPYFKPDMESGKLGNPVYMLLLLALKPLFWFAAHLHTKFAATVPFVSPDDPALTSSSRGSVPVGAGMGGREDECCAPGVSSGCTRFLALDKVIPGRDFLQVFQMKRPSPPTSSSVHNSDATSSIGGYSDGAAPKRVRVETIDRIEYDLEWLCIVKKTHYLLSTERGQRSMPSAINRITEKEMEDMRCAVTSRLTLLGGGLVIPYHDVDTSRSDCFSAQTDLLLSIIDRDDAFVRFATAGSSNNNQSSSSSSNYNMSTMVLPTADPNEIDI